ncbi:hypothetical protein LTR97_006228 [Elasticomyces elasticus]|uniref:Uncharacterized protein n=1 Tax=Elasticomyces elasticus TaxID=574655 RepID=A0AAN7WCF6_9PEZI|nr:hypothetical protein LTR97_006228 [Elasticomyces elasticus]
MIGAHRSPLKLLQGALVAACVLSMGARAVRMNARDETFEVLKPLAGDMIAVSYSDPYAVLPIEWTVPESLANRTIFISLVQGTDINSLSLVEIVNDTAPNNGSYTWYGSSGNSLYQSIASDGAPSGCNYSISLKSPAGEVFSPYFTIENKLDGGVARNATCPLKQGILSPGNGTYEPLPSQTPGEGHKTGTGTPNVSSNGVSTTTLAIAVAVPTAVLLLGFGLLLWLALKRGWLVRPGRNADQRAASLAEKEPLAYGKSGAVVREGMAPASDFMRGPSEIHGYERPAQVGGTEVYQLPAGEVRR